MADTRCANPEYQLDVDVMMLEYTIYKAVLSQLQNLRCQIEELSEDGSDGVQLSEDALEKRDEALRLQRTCDRLISLFRHHHPSQSFSAGCNYNIRILELLVLLEHWIQLSSRTLLGPGSNWMFPDMCRPEFIYPSKVPESLVNQFHQERAIETVFRRNWLGIRYSNEISQTKTHDGVYHNRRKLNNGQSNNDDKLSERNPDEDDNTGSTGTRFDSNQQKYTSSQNTALLPENEERPCLNTGIISEQQRLGLAARSSDVHDYSQTYSLFSITLFELIPRFMDLSAELASAMGNINERWIELASEMMWQSALERLQQMPDSQYTKPSDDPYKAISEDFGTRVWIEECFAWGSIPRPSRTSTSRIRRELSYLGVDTHIDNEFIRDRLRSEDDISAMLTQSSTHSTPNGHQDGNDNTEYPSWSQTRTTKLNDLLSLIIEEQPISENVPFYISVRKLCECSPIKPFLRNLQSYIQGIFDINVDPDFSGKPILVQIEEGQMEGLNEAEFRGFLDRVGLKISRSSDGTGGTVKWSK